MPYFLTQRNAAIFILLLLGSGEGYAQKFSFGWQNTPTLSIANKPLRNAWAGGLNSGQFATMHLNQDAQQDLVVFDRAGGRLTTYLAVPQPSGAFVWQHAPQYEALFPTDLQNWMQLIDYDKDGRKDLFTSTIAGIRVFKNVPTATAFGWQLVADPLLTQGFSGNINLYVQSSDLPAIVDLDNDGDLDVFAFDFTGNSVEYHQNFSAEQGNKQPFVYRKLNTCWGAFWKEHCNDFKLNQACGAGVGTGGRTARVMHAGNSLWAGDLNGDGLIDLLHGHITCTNIALLTNGTTNTNNAVVKSFDAKFPASNPINFSVFPSVYVQDVDFDGRPDLLTSPSVTNNEGNLVDFANSNWFYKNEGTNALPRFVYKQANFLQDQMLDLGENATPALADYDGDGDLDLWVSHAGVRTPQSGYRASVWFFRNVGTTTQAAFELVTTDFLGISEKLANDPQQRVLITNVKPFFADIDNNGTLDFGYVANTFKGMEVRYLTNTAPRGRAMQLNPDRLFKLPTPDNFLNGETAFFYDIDADGRNDLLIGKGSGNIELHRNVGTSAAPIFELTNEFWGGFDVDFDTRSLAVADLNGDRKPELVVSGLYGSLQVFEDFLEANAKLKPNNDLIFSELLKKNGILKAGTNLTLALGDLNADQRPDLVLGLRNGGLLLLQNNSPLLPPAATQNAALLVYPNPAQNFLYARVAALGKLQLFNVLGQQVRQVSVNQIANEAVIDTDDLAAGLYFVSFVAIDGTQTTQKVWINR